jgi:hypothetical protein
MASWTTDLRDLPTRGARDVEKTTEERAEFLREVVEAATSRRADKRWTSAVQCIARTGHRKCSGLIQVQLAEADLVEWRCTTCGEDGVVCGFTGGESDMSPYEPRGKEVNWGMDKEERQVLLDATVALPELRAVVARCKPHADVPGLLLVRATVAELDEMYTLVEDLTGGTRSRKRRELLDGLRMSLSTAIDGF